MGKNIEGLCWLALTRSQQPRGACVTIRRNRTRFLLATFVALGVLLGGCAPASRAVAPARGVSAAGPAASWTASSQPSWSVSASEAATTTFAVIGDYGDGGGHEAEVARLVASWQPAYVLTVGDCYYANAGGSGLGRYANSTGAFYGPWLKDVAATSTPSASVAATRNAFFPVLGNHDYTDATPAPATYLAYFTLPGAGFTNTSGNERYYDFVEGPIHFFALDSCTEEPNGTIWTSAQARWLQRGLAASTSKYNVVYDHHPPYASDAVHGSTDYMRWPFAQWGADAVISGHAHIYERGMHDGIPYIVDGLGGAPRYALGTPVTGSVARYSSGWGAEKVTLSAAGLSFEFYNVKGALIDRYVVAAK